MKKKMITQEIKFELKGDDYLKHEAEVAFALGCLIGGYQVRFNLSDDQINIVKEIKARVMNYQQKQTWVAKEGK